LIAEVLLLGFGLGIDLLSMLSTASGDEVIFGEDEDGDGASVTPVRSASLRNEPAGGFSDGIFELNCCCCLECDDDELRWGDAESLMGEEWVWTRAEASGWGFLCWEERSMVRSITEGRFVEDRRRADGSEWGVVEVAGFGFMADCSEIYKNHDDQIEASISTTLTWIAGPSVDNGRGFDCFTTLVVTRVAISKGFACWVFDDGGKEDLGSFTFASVTRVALGCWLGLGDDWECETFAAVGEALSWGSFLTRSATAGTDGTRGAV
jgi:hypothetical protein